MKDNKSDFTRRKFLSAAAAGLATAGMAGLSPGMAMATDEKKEKAKQEIIYRHLGKTGPKIPIISMGSGSTTDPAIVQAAFEKGIRHFDTAAGYGYGSNEQLIGRVLNKMGVREKANIGTKITAYQELYGLPAKKAKEETIKMLEGSLKRLKTDYVDILYQHDLNSAEMVSNPGIIEGLAELKAQKKILQAGTSTHTNMAEVINETIKHDVYDVVLTSFNFTMADDKALMDAVANAGKKGVGVLAMKTQAGGARWPNPESRQNYSNSTIMTAALKWVLNNKSVTTCIPALTNYDMLDEDFSVAYDIEYTEDERNLLNDNNALLSLGFCRQCKKCLASCPNGADIPNLMRIHMYAAQYGDIRYARQTFDSIGKGAGLDACSNCSTCTANCANTVDIDRRIEELKLIYS